MNKLLKLVATTFSMGIVLLGLSQVNAQTMCTMQYDPVCGVDGTTYGNACTAQGVEIAYKGECIADIVDVDPNDGVVGNDVDQYGCIASAGYLWDDSKKQCVRLREQDGSITLLNKILRAHERGITKYNTLTAFMPEQLLTREQAAKMLVAAVQSQPNLEIPLKEMYCVFADQASIDPTLSDQVNIACQYGLFQGYKGNFMPTMFMNDVDTMTILGRVAAYSPAINMYLATSQFATPTYKPMTRAMFVDWLFTMSTYIDQYAAQDNMTMLNDAQSDLDNARNMWTDKKLNTYTIVQTKSCFCTEDYRRSIQYNVTNSLVVSGAKYKDTMQMINPEQAPELHTVEQAFAMIQQAIDDKVDSVSVEYDATRGYPTSISIDVSRMMADEEQYYTFEITDATLVTNELIGSYTLISYDGTGVTNTGITLTFEPTRVGAKICNNIGANYILSGNILIISAMISTKMACIDTNLTSLESSFSSMNSVNYTMSGDQLTLMSNNHTWAWVRK